MSRLDGEVIEKSLSDATISRLDAFEVFSEIDSTNSYLMQRSAPLPGRMHVAVTDNQTRGRGRHGRSWESPPGSGLCLSIAYAFAEQPANLPALTLAIGFGVIGALEAAGVGGVQIKWPNDLVAGGAKLGGILTETRAETVGATSVVTGVGINVDFGSGRQPQVDQPVIDLSAYAERPPSLETLAVCLIDALGGVFARYSAEGLTPYLGRWAEKDWLLGREVTIDAPGPDLRGVGAGIDEDGALLLDTANGIVRVTSGSVVLASPGEANS